MKNDDFTQQVTQQLDHLARTHRNKTVVMEHVLEEIKDKSIFSQLMTWKMTGFALVAAITGFVVLPNSIDLNDKQNVEQVIVSPKLSPQMMEDLDMLSVFGEENAVHGS